MVAFSPASIIVDANYTFREILTPGGGATDMVISMEDRDGIYDSTKQSLTVDVKYTADQQSDKDGSDYKVIQMRQYGKDGNMTIQNGVLNFTKSDDVGNNTVQIDLFSNSDRRADAGKIYNKSFTLAEAATINSTENLRIKGMRADGVNYSQAYINGVMNLTSGIGNTPHKNLIFENVDVTFSAGASITAKDLIFNGSNFSFTQGTTINNFRTVVGSGSLVKIGEGVNVTAGALVVNANGTVEIAGTYTTSRNPIFAGKDELGKLYYTDVDNVAVSGTLHLKSTGKLLTNDFYKDVNITSGGKIILDAGSKLVTSRWVRLSDNSTLVMNGKDTLLATENGQSKDSLIWLWGGNMRVEFNSDNAIKGFCFSPRNSSTSTATTVLTIALGSNCNLLELGTLTAETDGYSGFLSDGCSLIIEGFKNDTIKITSLRDGKIDSKTGKYSEDDLSRISAAGFEEGSFFLEFVNGIDASDGYWLNAIAIPEPATIAALLGALALGLAIRRKRK